MPIVCGQWVSGAERVMGFLVLEKKKGEWGPPRVARRLGGHYFKKRDTQCDFRWTCEIGW
jgi:hypothetical protein